MPPLRRFLRALLWSGIALAALALAGGGGGYLWLRTSLPQTEGSVTLSGLSGPVEIFRDAHGIPHIFAQSDADAYYALGFLHAQDRLWQMETGRRAGAGRLSEIFGRRTLESDVFLRTLGIHRRAEQSFAALDPSTRTLIEAYTAGVNAWLGSHNGALPPEFAIFRFRPARWRPADSLVLITMMALELDGNAGDEVLRSRLGERLSAAQIAALWPAEEGDGMPAPLKAERPPMAPALLDGLAEMIPPSPRGLGSNNWAVDGRHTESGRPLLANDPHLGLEIPGPWYLAHLSAPGLAVAGATLPGIPVVVVGRNERVAWGVTNTGSDVQDLFVERADPADPGRYLTPSGSEPFDTREEVIHVDGEDPVTLRVRETRHGPVVSDAVRRYATTEGRALAFAWTALYDRSKTLRAGFALARAEDWDTFVAALRDYHGPQQNFVYADVDGNLGFYAAGRVPIREGGDGRVPAPGWTGAHDWTGMIPFEDLPHRYDPADGRIATANNRIVGDDYPYFLTHDWAAPYRIRRIEQRLETDAPHTAAGFEAIQTDHLSLFAHSFLPRLLAETPESDRGREAHRLLTAWDGRMESARPEPLIFAAWYRALTRRLYADELGPYFPAAWNYRPRFVAEALSGSAGDWCDDTATPAEETCGALVTAALEEALASLTERHGPDMNAWQWGEAHRARLRHRTFDGVPVLGRMFSRSVPQSGGTFTVLQAGNVLANEAAPFDAVHGVSMRVVFDLGDPDATRAILPTGQSGNPLSPWYDDQLPLWLDGETVALPMSREAAEGIATFRLTLEPEHEE